MLLHPGEGVWLPIQLQFIQNINQSCLESVMLLHPCENMIYAMPLALCLATWASFDVYQIKCKTSYANGQRDLGHKHKAPDHNHEATQPMVDLPHDTSRG